MSSLPMPFNSDLDFIFHEVISYISYKSIYYLHIYPPASDLICRPDRPKSKTSKHNMTAIAIKVSPDGGETLDRGRLLVDENAGHY